VSKRQPNKQYNVAKPDSLAVRIAGYQRRFMYDRFLEETEIDAHHTLLDVGVTSDRSYPSSNYLEAWYPHKSSITAIGIDDASFLRELYPGVKFLRASGLLLPFRNATFDVVHASAVLEHVGSSQNQLSFIKECCRVARRSVFMTTPNRWFPIEFHTLLPLVHWLPKPAFRVLMRGTGLRFYAEESNLNLLYKRNVRSITSHIDDFHFSVSTVSLWGWPSNLLLVGRRVGVSAKRE
jgi:hypothetical protein